jgi:hypothetical protein
MQIRCPELSKQLMDYLDAVFPDSTVDPDKTNPHRAYGRAEVIRHLKAVLQQQQEE